MNWKNKLTEIKVGDIVQFKSDYSNNAKYFKHGLTNLEIKKIIYENDTNTIIDLVIYESDKNNSWFVNPHEIKKM